MKILNFYEKYSKVFPNYLVLKENEYFVLADSRSNAEDSRYFGTVKKDEILGTVITVMRRNNI